MAARKKGKPRAISYGIFYKCYIFGTKHMQYFSHPIYICNKTPAYSWLQIQKAQAVTTRDVHKAQLSDSNAPLIG